VNRLPIRVRLTLAFAVAMAIVLAGVGAFVYLRVEQSLTEQLDEGLERRAEALAPLVERGEPLPHSGEEEVARVVDGVETVPRERDGLRLLAVPADGRTLVLGTSVEDRDEALDGLLAQLLVAGPVALLLGSIAAYAVAGAAVRPVEEMRRRADEISADTSGRRLPLPQARDEIARLGATLNAMLDRLDAGLRRERRFVADAGHELRTPLALLKAELEMALRRPRSAAELEQAVRSAGDEVDRLARLADDLLALASSDGGGLPLNLEDVDVSDVVAAVARRFASRAPALDLDAPRGLVVRGDRLRLEQAIGNLVDNALRHGAATVRVRAAREDGRVAVRVADGGRGFALAFLPRAFEPFSRADEARARGGAGLGLAIVDAVARAHGGEARAANRREGGAEVTLLLPAHGRFTGRHARMRA
jgi:two-component system OmpR family sensor kinase